ncbi:hypothetical protein CVT25_009931 [Psilocybe cyanescens]|uniref:AB hydrolase-1 domain-containing protein n=1 Tax=Psilocybe cyanescens TaxID=93625 RepID=A0A409XCT7_PSICY|nr:hypothetical protein CVT25_009931 [Psilocybe cyanescens]
MPFVDLIIPDAGVFSFRYSIATPSSKSAESIAPHLPCIIFLHSCFVSQEVFELQFSDVFLRQFNLIAIDMRGYGETRGFIKEERYTPVESARDVEQIMDKLHLPPCHFFGLSNGCTVALELAISRPDLVLSLSLCSPLPPVEPKEIIAGRMEVCEYWRKMDESNNSGEQAEAISEELANEVFIGSSQLLYNNTKSNIAQTLSNFGLTTAKNIWAGSPEKLQNCHKSNIEWVLERRPDIDKLYGKIKAPVTIIHCSEDIAYPIHHAEELDCALRKANVAKVSLHTTQGSHFGNVTNSQQVNKIVYETIISHHPELSLIASYSSKEADHNLPTPWTDLLIERYGYEPFDDDLN